MTPIKTDFRKDGFDFKQVWREAMVCIYSKTKPAWDHKRYEVAVLRNRAASKTTLGAGTREARDVSFAASERYPATEHWGKYGWSYPDLAMAKSKFSELVAKRAPTTTT